MKIFSNQLETPEKGNKDEEVKILCYYLKKYY